MPDEGVRRQELGLGGGRGAEALQGVGDAPQKGQGFRGREV
jgi:hypothetical protein